MQLDWISRVPASALYAALSLVRGRALIEPATEAALRPEVAALEAELTPYCYETVPLLRELIALSASSLGEAELAKTALDKLAGRSHDARAEPGLANRIGRIIAAFSAAQPRAAAELPLRMDPLRGQWEARGPGLLTGMRRLTTPELLVPAASVLLVQPVLGGGGLPHPTYNRVTFEAVLANPIAQLPEVLRLGWLLGQLNFDLPNFEETLGRERLETIGPLALIPVVLAAAEDVELARADDQHLQLALTSWLNQPVSKTVDAAEVLSRWWETYQISRPSWAAALVVLDALWTKGHET